MQPGALLEMIRAEIVAETLAALREKLNAVLAEMQVQTERQRKPHVRRGAAGSAPSGITQWTPDARARRVPRFVKDATGLRTKPEVLKRYGADAVFMKNGPLPPVLKRLSPAP